MGRKPRIVLAALAALVALLALLLFWFSRPQNLAGLVMSRAGAALGLEITATGASEYRLRGTPQLVLRGVSARQPGSDVALLTADRILLSLPWATLRAAGRDLTVERIELDRPVLSWPALMRWLDSRPPSGPPRLPTLTRGIAVADGRLAGDGWQVDGVNLRAASFSPGQPARIDVGGRHASATATIPFDLVLDIADPRALVDGDASQLRATGTVAPALDARSLPATIVLSGPARLHDGRLSLAPLRFGASGRLLDGASEQPFVLGVNGPFQLDADGVGVNGAGLVLRGTAPGSLLPTLHAAGDARLAWGAPSRLRLALAGALADWPEAWPALPPPIGQSDAPLPFRLDYDGVPDASDPARLQLRRDATAFDARFALPRVLAWVDQLATGTPLPPLDGRLTTPRLEISGAVLEGVEVEVEFEDGAQG